MDFFIGEEVRTGDGYLTGEACLVGEIPPDFAGEPGRLTGEVSTPSLSPRTF